jgi:hypothetical protein
LNRFFVCTSKTENSDDDYTSDSEGYSSSDDFNPNGLIVRRPVAQNLNVCQLIHKRFKRFKIFDANKTTKLIQTIGFEPWNVHINDVENPNFTVPVKHKSMVKFQFIDVKIGTLQFKFGRVVLVTNKGISIVTKGKQA